MLKFNYPRVFKSRGIDRPFSFLVNNGYSTNMATRIVNNRTRQVNLRDLEKLCMILKCTPNDFFDWVPGREKIDIEHHPLNAINRGDKVVQLEMLVNNIPMDKLADIESLIKREMEK
jgi:hypothetical protein